MATALKKVVPIDDVPQSKGMVHVCPNCSHVYHPDASDIIKRGNWVLFLHVIFYKDRTVNLTPAQVKMLRTLAVARTIITPDQWGMLVADDWLGVKDLALLCRVHVAKLRRRLKDQELPDPIFTEYHKGYRFQDKS